MNINHINKNHKTGFIYNHHKVELREIRKYLDECGKGGFKVKRLFCKWGFLKKGGWQISHNPGRFKKVG